MKNATHKGFTLIELSIVLIIIGLLVGGVLVGRDLIEQAQLSAVANEITAYDAARNTFQVKYGDGILPGDMDNATSFFPTAAGNGNGDGVFTDATEAIYYWNHLSLAGVIDGTYTGVTETPPRVLGDTNIPESSYQNGYYHVSYTTTTTYYDLTARALGNYMILGKPRDPLGDPADALVSALAAQNLDGKIDDGVPDTGRLFSLRATNPTNGATCVDNEATTSATAGNYVLNNDGLGCIIMQRF